MAHCVLCFKEIKEESVPCYPPKLNEVCCKYFHSSLTEETLLSQSKSNNLPFCLKCFDSVVQLNSLNDQFEFYQKKISDFVFILSLEILHRRGNRSNSHSRPNIRSSKRQLIEFDVSPLPNCDFKKSTTVVLEENEIEMKTNNYQGFNGPLPILSNSRSQDEIGFNSQDNEGKAVGIGSDNTNSNPSSESIESQTVWTKYDFGGSFKITDTRKTSKNCLEDSRRIPCISTINSFQVSSSSVTKCGTTLPTGQELKAYTGFHLEKKQVNYDVYENLLERNRCTLNSDERPYKCPIYEKGVKLKHHLLPPGVRGDRPFKCKVCGKGFTQRGNLTIHTRIHTGEKPFKCEVCSKGFPQKYKLIAHKRIHNEERPYECEVCGRGFRQSSTLKIHSRIHTAEEPYKWRLWEDI